MEVMCGPGNASTVQRGGLLSRLFFFSSRRRHTRCSRDWSSDVCSSDLDSGQLRRVPAESVIHLYDPLRPGQLRGIPHLTQALIKLHEVDKYDDAVLLRQQLDRKSVV